MLFDFQAFIAELREKEDKKLTIEKYESILWPIEWDIRDQLRYSDYLAKFASFDYITPDDIGNDFNRDLLQKLIIASFSSSYELKKDDKKNWYELYITVKSGDQTIVKTISELWAYQISRLFEIYIEEQINNQMRIANPAEDSNEENKLTILHERETKIRRRNSFIDTLNNENLAQQAKSEQSEKLNDLMWQL